MKGKIKREKLLISISALLVLLIVLIAAMIMGVLGKNLNEYLSGTEKSSSSDIKFDFDAYKSIGF